MRYDNLSDDDNSFGFNVDDDDFFGIQNDLVWNTNKVELNFEDMYDETILSELIKAFHLKKGLIDL